MEMISNHHDPYRQLYYYVYYDANSWPFSPESAVLDGPPDTDLCFLVEVKENAYSFLSF